jgi:DNA polymerase-1
MESEILTKTYRTAGQVFNLNAAGQKAKLLFSPKSEGGQGLKPKVLTDGGKKKEKAGQELTYSDYSTGKEILEDRYPNNDLVACMLEYNEVHKLLSTYVQGYLGVADDPKKPCRIFNGRIHADLVSYGTVTGRFSCREPNLQNIPRPDTDLGKKIRGLFKAPPGYKMVVADYGQIEMIILAHLIGYGALFDGIRNGMDPHSATAAGLAGIDPEEFMRLVEAGDPRAKAARQVAKGVNFAVVYGAGPEKVAAMAGITVKEAKRFLEIHMEMFPEIYRFKDKVLRVAKERRPPHIRTLLGRKRRLPALWSKDYGSRGYAERQAVNSLIQGSAADIIKLAMVRLHQSLEPDMRLILSVHDELVTLCPEDKADRCAEIVKEAMLGEGITGLLSVPLSSDLKIVDRWSEAK